METLPLLVLPGFKGLILLGIVIAFPPQKLVSLRPAIPHQKTARRAQKW